MTAVRVAIVGSGPSGMYAAGHLLRHGGADFHVDVFERLATPWGLVRAGVAPDHPKIKSVTRVFEKHAADQRFRLFANVELGTHVTVQELREHYHAIIYAVGTPADRPLGIPGEELPGSWAATDFVGWYNAHPDFRELEFDLDTPRAVVIGAGNVALDVARMLLLAPESLAKTDVADHALDALSRSGVQEVVVLARRGPEQAAFTNPELLELSELLDADIVIDRADLAAAQRNPDPGSDATAKRNVEIMRGYAERQLTADRRRIVLRFLCSPVEIVGEDCVQRLVIERNELAAGDDGSLRAAPTGQRETIDAGLVLRAIGYRGTPLPGVPFDQRRSVIANDSGRVQENGTTRRGEYVVGWAKRGPSGVIGTNKKDAQETVNALIDDLQADRLGPLPQIDGSTICELLADRQPELVSYSHWELIDKHERSLGEPEGRPRVKLTRLDDFLAAAELREVAER